MGGDFVELLVYPHSRRTTGRFRGDERRLLPRTARPGSLSPKTRSTAGWANSPAPWPKRWQGRGGRIRTGIEVRAVRPVSQGVDVEWDDGAARHAAVIVATPSDTARAILAPGGLDERADSWLAAVRRAPAASLGLVVEGRIPAEFFGLSFPPRCYCRRTGRRALRAGTQGAALDPSRAAASSSSPRPARPTAPRARRRARRSNASSPRSASPSPPSSTGSSEHASTATPAARRSSIPADLEHLRNFDPDTLPARIALAGDYLVAPTVAGAVRSGLHAARRVRPLARLRRCVTCSGAEDKLARFQRARTASRPGGPHTRLR